MAASGVRKRFSAVSGASRKLSRALGPGLATITEDKEKAKESWRKLLEPSAARIYPTHGKPFSAEIIKKALK